MNYDLYTIVDKLAGEAGPIFQAKNSLVAMRYVKEMLKDSNVDPSEYDLVRLGHFDTESVAIYPSPMPLDSIHLSDVSICSDDAKSLLDSDFDDYGSKEVVDELDAALSNNKEVK